MYKALVEFNLDSAVVQRRLDVTKIENPYLVNVSDAYRNSISTAISKENNLGLPWKGSYIIFNASNPDANEIINFTVLMEK